jgi:hypothetical protein
MFNIELNTLGDLEQLLLRSGVTYKPTNTDVNMVVAHITTGAIGEVIKLPLRHRFIKTLLPLKVGKRLYFNRFRYEQRFVENQILEPGLGIIFSQRTNKNKTTLSKKCLFVALQ